MMPLFGVAFLHWTVFPLMLLFWTENVIFGLFNVLKMLVVAVQGKEVSVWTGLDWILRFCLLWGGFTFVHGVFVMAMFGGGHILAKAGFPTPGVFWSAIIEYHLQWVILGLVVSHAVSFAHDFLWKGVFREADIMDFMIGPFIRMVVMHIFVFAGGIAVRILGSPVIGVVVLVLFKTGLDLFKTVWELAANLRDRRERTKFAAHDARERNF